MAERVSSSCSQLSDIQVVKEIWCCALQWTNRSWSCLSLQKKMTSPESTWGCRVAGSGHHRRGSAHAGACARDRNWDSIWGRGTSLVYLAICQTTIWQDFVIVSLLVFTHAQNTIQLLNCSIIADKMTKPNLSVAILYIILAHERCLWC